VFASCSALAGAREDTGTVVVGATVVDVVLIVLVVGATVVDVVLIVLVVGATVVEDVEGLAVLVVEFPDPQSKTTKPRRMNPRTRNASAPTAFARWRTKMSSTVSATFHRNG
jgi:hypothetical protein